MTAIATECVSLPIYGNIGRYPVYPVPPVPPKGAEIGIRFIGSIYDMSWIPARVESFDGKTLVTVEPTTGRRDACLWTEQVGAQTSGVYEWDFAANIRFADTCVTCKGAGEYVIPGSEVVATCIDCDGWGSIGYKPFKAKRQRRQKRTPTEAA